MMSWWWVYDWFVVTLWCLSFADKTYSCFMDAATRETRASMVCQLRRSFPRLSAMAARASYPIVTLKKLPDSHPVGSCKPFHMEKSNRIETTDWIWIRATMFKHHRTSLASRTPYHQHPPLWITHSFHPKFWPKLSHGVPEWWNSFRKVQQQMHDA